MITQAKQNHNSPNPLARFVTKEAVAKVLNVAPQKIREIRLWPYVIHVVGEGISRFVSYGDMPPIVAVQKPTPKDVAWWHKRWRQNQPHLAPDFWVEFFEAKFREAPTESQLFAWGELVGFVKHGLAPEKVAFLQQVYRLIRHDLRVSLGNAIASFNYGVQA